MIITLTANTRNDCTVARVVVEVLCQSWGYPVSVTYNDGKSFDVKVPNDKVADNAIAKFKRLAPDLNIRKSSKDTMAKSVKESKSVKEACVRIDQSAIDLAKADIANKVYGLDVVIDGDTHELQVKGDQAAIDSFLSDMNLTNQAKSC